MEKKKKIQRGIFLIVGILVGLLIFLSGSQLTQSLSQAKKGEVKIENTNNNKPFLKNFFS